MTRRTLAAFGAAALAAGALGAVGLSTTGSGRADCPGRVRCPLTGEMVCRDRCPVLDPDREDCPGLIQCPLTGEPVCRDRCPLAGTAESEAATPTPSCCESEQ